MNEQLIEKYNILCETKSDINEHLPTLKRLASLCDTVTEMWVRTALSSHALLMWCDDVVSYDLESTQPVEQLQWLCPNWKFNTWDTREIDIVETDMLFIDTLHNGELLREELKRHAPKVRRFIAFHDTVSFWDHWETKDEWLLPAINDYIAEYPEREKLKVFDNNNGLTILRRKTEPVVTVFTAIFGGYDTLKLQPNQTKNCKFICFTDNKELAIERWAEKQREVILCDNNKDLHNRMRAKRYRMHPKRDKGTQIVYMDGTARLKREDSIEYFIKQNIDNDIVCFKHPERDCIMDEAMFIHSWWDIRWKKYTGLPIKKQAEHYIAEWYPLHWWLNASWLLIYKITDKILDFFEKRWDENVKRTYQDQLSFEPIAYKYNINRKWLETDGNLRHNKYITFLEWHLSDA